jgi:kynurenine formamidase
LTPKKAGWEDLMFGMRRSSLLLATVMTIALAPAVLAAADTPIGPAWWPSRWGPADEAGASNWMTPEKVLTAVMLVKTGKTYRLGRDYEAGMPLFGARVFVLRIPGAPTGGVLGKNKVVWHDEFLATEIGQVGTQFDGLGHIGAATGAPGDKAEMRFYNGVTESEMASATGLQKLGVEKVKPLVTRGIVLDMAGLEGRMLREGEEITVADLQAALARQGLAEAAITPGDAVLIHTGWGSLWMKDNARYGAGEPGIGVEAAKWLAAKQVAMIGADTWGVEVAPNPDADLAFPAHQELITKNGIFLQENLDLSALVADQAWEFLYVFAPVPIKGATGSPGSPIAIR